jgi:hypothetical protein
MAADTAPPPLPPDEDWDGSFEAAEQHRRDGALAATPSQRLAWLEEAIAFAARAGALPKKE